MVNCNPETVSTDYDTSDRLYFEPLTVEHVMAVIEREKPDGVIVQLGGQTPLKLARRLAAAGVPIWGTSPDAIDLAEDRKRFGALLAEEGIRQPEARHRHLARGGRRGRPAHRLPGPGAPELRAGRPGDGDLLRRGEPRRLHAGGGGGLAGRAGAPRPLPRRRHRARRRPAGDGERAVVAGVLRHIEEAGIHSGDSAAVLPPPGPAPSASARSRWTRCARSPAGWRCASASSA